MTALLSSHVFFSLQGKKEKFSTDPIPLPQFLILFKPVFLPGSFQKPNHVSEYSDSKHMRLHQQQMALLVPDDSLLHF